MRRRREHHGAVRTNRRRNKVAPTFGSIIGPLFFLVPRERPVLRTRLTLSLVLPSQASNLQPRETMEPSLALLGRA